MTVVHVVIVIPVFNDQPSLHELVKELAVIFRGFSSKLHFVVVDDGSLPPVTVTHLAVDAGLSGEILLLKRNMGHQRAIAIGMAHTVESQVADIIVVMDADGEDRPSDVVRLISAIEKREETAIAVGERTKRSEGFLFTVLYVVYRLLFIMLTGQSIRYGSFSAMRLAAARRLVDMSELWLSLPATILRSYLPIFKVPTERGRRYHGASHMNLVSLVVHAFSTMAVFIERVLTRMILGALILVGICVLAVTAAVILKLMALATPGWLTTVLGTSLVLLISTGILCFVGLFVSISGGAQSVAPPSACYRSLIGGITRFGLDTRTEIDSGNTKTAP